MSAPTRSLNIRCLWPSIVALVDDLSVNGLSVDDLSAHRFYQLSKVIMEVRNHKR